MQIRVAEHKGFCFGVRRAVKLAYRTLEGKQKVCSLGSLIHNPQVVKQLSRKGLKVVESLDGIKNGTVVIRSHGFSPHLIEKAKKSGLGLVDATCPFVKKAHDILKKLKGKGYTIVVIGDKKHPEVEALVGFAGNDVVVIEKEAQVRGLKLSARKIGVIAQTTQSRENFSKVVGRLVEKGVFEMRVFDTICDDTIKRQISAENIAASCDLMLILGGRMSANNRRLAQICARTGTRTYHIETAGQINPAWLDRVKSVGLAGGASTPDWIIEEAIDKLRIYAKTLRKKILRPDKKGGVLRQPLPIRD